MVTLDSRAFLPGALVPGTEGRGKRTGRKDLGGRLGSEGRRRCGTAAMLAWRRACQEESGLKGSRSRRKPRGISMYSARIMRPRRETAAGVVRGSMLGRGADREDDRGGSYWPRRVIGDARSRRVGVR